MTGQYSQYDLESMSVPTLVVHAKDDPLASFGDIERLVERIPTAEFQRYETGGHLVFGHGDEIRQSVTDFVASPEGETDEP